VEKTSLYDTAMFKECQKEDCQNSTEVNAKTKESTRKTEEKLDGRNKQGHERERNLNEGQWEDRKQWSLRVGQRRRTF
jgi:hypothetical protein